MLIEQKLPLDVTPEDNKLDDPAERERLMRVFDRGLRPAGGYVLPLLVTQGARRQTPLHHRALGVPARAPVPDARRLAHRPAAAAGGLPEIAFVDYPHVLPADPFAAPEATCRRGAETVVDQHPLRPDRPGRQARSRCARRWPSSRATAICACSCRRSPTARTTPR